MHGHGMKIMKQTSRLNLTTFSFSHRVVDDWNSLPGKVVEARDVVTCLLLAVFGIVPQGSNNSPRLYSEGYSKRL